MENIIPFFSQNANGKKILNFLLLFLFSNSIVFAQTITPTKTVIKNSNSCSIIDVELKIQGANPIARPLEVVLVIDVSGSMAYTISGDSNTPMDYAKDAATDFINTFFLPANNPTNLNKLSIVTYSTTATLKQGLTLTSGKSGLLSIINGLTANGSTNIQDGIVKADNELTAHGSFNCNTSRSIVLLTDGVANVTGPSGSSCSSGTGGSCIQSAITAATNAKTTTVSSIIYNNQIFSVGLFGAISGTDQTNAQFCLNGIQSGGSFFTESGANLAGIYSQIFNQLSWVAAQITGTPFEKETVNNNFDIVASSISVSKGTFTQSGQVINWNLDFLNVETITLKYQLTPKANICGDNIVSTSRLDYQNSACSVTSQNPTTPNYCVPCTPILSALPAPSTIYCPTTPAFTTPTITNGCQSSSLTFVDVTTAGNCAGSYSVKRTWTASNACFSATASQTINVQDNTAPVIATLPAVSTINCPATPVFAQATATDACGSAFTLTFADVTTAGNCAGSYSVTRTWTAKDACNNASTASQTINVQDNTAPVINTQASNLTVECDGSGNNNDLQLWLNNNGGASASDACSNVTWSNNYNTLSDGCGGTGSAVVTFTASDSCGNTVTTSGTFIIHDTTNPVLIGQLPVDVTVQCDNVPAPIVLIASDNCDNAVQVVYTQNIVGQDDACSSNYIITRKWSVTDCAGNNTFHTQNINVIDTIAPTLSTPLDSVLNISCGEIPDVPELVFVDNCSNSVSFVFTQVEINHTDYTYTIIRTWVASDSCGNSDEFTQTINVTINEPFSYVTSSLCIKGGNKDLFQLLDPNVEHTGTWLDVNNSGGLSGSVLDPSNIPPGFYVYRYTISDGNCPRIIEIYMTINNDCFVLGCDISKLNISKVVTPNNDGYNDFFKIGGIEDCGFTYEVKMFNRWGALVYENNNYKNDWDGKANGAISNSNLPSGTYYYIVNIVNSGFDTFKGYIYLGTKN